MIQFFWLAISAVWALYHIHSLVYGLSLVLVALAPWLLGGVVKFAIWWTWPEYEPDWDD